MPFECFQFQLHPWSHEGVAGSPRLRVSEVPFKVSATEDHMTLRMSLTAISSYSTENLVVVVLLFQVFYQRKATKFASILDDFSKFEINVLA